MVVLLPHAAVVARQFGVPCVVGASMIKIDIEKRQMEVNGRVLKEGDWITIDGEETVKRLSAN